MVVEVPGVGERVWHVQAGAPGVVTAVEDDGRIVVAFDGRDSAVPIDASQVWRTNPFQVWRVAPSYLRGRVGVNADQQTPRLLDDSPEVPGQGTL